MNNVAIIPARSGSKGLANKNIKKLNGLPLISYTIKAALDSGVFDRVIVSTDSETYAKIAKKFGAEVPYLRSKKLSGDNTTTFEVIEDLVNNLNDIKTFMLLQPTSPFRSSKHIKKAYELFLSNNDKPIISVNKSSIKLEIINTLDDKKDMNNFMKNKTSTLRQKYQDYYQLNGAIYISKVEDYLKNKTFFIAGSQAYIMGELESLDIDNEFDFWLARKLIEDEMIEID